MSCGNLAARRGNNPTRAETTDQAPRRAPAPPRLAPVLARRYLVSGRVQGVAFRHHTKLEARALGLDGLVRNLADGRVECIARGPASALQHLEAFLRLGPAGARVAQLEVRDEPVDDARFAGGLLAMGDLEGGRRFVVDLD
jgi:acylphosphatase